MSTLIKNGTMVTDSLTYIADIWIEADKITKIGKDLKPTPDTRIIDAEGKLVLPGAIDTHVHFQLPFCGTVSKDDFINGSQAAALGGVTTFIDFATQQSGHSLQESIKDRMAEAEGKVCIDYSLHASITDWNERTRNEIRDVIAKGIPSFKMYMIYKNEGWMASDAALFFALQETSKWGGMVAVHAENNDIIDGLIHQTLNNGSWRTYGAYAHYLTRPAYTEAEAIQRAITLAENAKGTLYIVHTSSKDGLQAIREGQNRGVSVYAETCPQYLLLDAKLLQDQKTGHLYATCPPIRGEQDRKALWSGLAKNIRCVGTDTCTFDTKQKSLWDGKFTDIPFGMPGIETVLPLMFTEGYRRGKITLNQLVAITSTNAAKIFGLYPQKGTICVGGDADLVIFDPNKEKVIRWQDLHTDCDWSPYQGTKVIGWPAVTLSRGRVIVENDQFIGEAGWGRFVPGHQHQESKRSTPERSPF